MSDTDWSSVSWLLHCDGSNGSTTFTDSGPVGLSVSGLGSPTLSTSGPKFGSARLALEGTKAIQIASNAALNFGTGSFTAEGWVYADSVGYAYRSLYSFGNDYDTANLYLTTGDDGAVLSYWMDGAVRIVHQLSVSAGAWHHFALVRSGNQFALFWNGVISSTIYTSSASMPSGLPLIVGASNSSIEDPINGRLDELRGTKGVARYTSTFSVPTAAFPEGAAGPPELYGVGSSALGRGAARLLAPHDARGLGASALGVGKGLVGRSEVRTLAGSGLGVGKFVGGNQSVRVSAIGPLGRGSNVLGNRSIRVFGGSALGAGKSFIDSPRLAWVSGGSALGSGKGRAYNDFTGAVDPASTLAYVADLITPDGIVRVPISSWQATLQTDQACYGQMVVPAIFEQLESVTSATEAIVYRKAALTGGGNVEQIMLRFPVETRSLSQGSTNYTAVLSGYFDAFPGESDLPAEMTRDMLGVRSISEDGGGTRLRCDVDWLLRPGMKARYGSTEIDVSYINYYVPGSDQYMDIGERV